MIIKSVKSCNLCKSVIQTIYDIVKAYGGELKVETSQGEGSQFVIQLPLDSHSSRSNPLTSQ